MSMRNFDTLLLTTTQTNQLRNVPTIRSTCSQTETSSLSAPNVWFAHVFFQPASLALQPTGSTTLLFIFRKCDVDIRVNLHIPVMLPGGTTMFQGIDVA